MSRQQEILDLMAPVLQSLIPAKERVKYAHLPVSLWLPLYPQLADGKMFERRIKGYVKQLVRADQLGYGNAINLMEKLLRAPHTQFYERHAGSSDWFWATPFFEVRLGKMAKRTERDWMRFEAKMRDLELVKYVLGQLSGSKETATYYQMLLDEDNAETWEAARLASSVRTFLDFSDWWQVEGIWFKKQHPNLHAYRSEVNPFSFRLTTSGVLLG